jgi:hypothetical protein
MIEHGNFDFTQGIFDIRETEKDLVLISPGNTVGGIKIKKIESQIEINTLMHKSIISILALNKDASLFASASVYVNFMKTRELT